MSFDNQLFAFLYSFANRHWLFDGFFIFLAQYLPYVLILALLISIFLFYKKWKERLYYLFLSAFSLLIARGLFVEIIRFFYRRLRPFQVLNFEPLIKPLSSASMPSGHATVFFAVALLMFYINRKYFWHFLIGAILVGIGRVVVGVHWPMDIVVGVIVGMASVLIARKLLPFIPSADNKPEFPYSLNK